MLLCAPDDICVSRAGPFEVAANGVLNLNGPAVVILRDGRQIKAIWSHGVQQGYGAVSRMGKCGSAGGRIFPPIPPHQGRSASATGSRAARMAGNNPPIRPMMIAHTMPSIARAGVIRMA